MIALFLPLLLAVQTTPTPPMPPANPLPPPGTDEAGVLAPINAMFAGLAANDPAAVRAQVLAEGTATVVKETAGGASTVRHMAWDQFVAGIEPGTGKLEERLLGPAIDVAGDIAMVWSRYVFLVDGKVAHCGTDHFDLIRKDGRWKVLNVTWTQRTTGCEPA